MEIYIINFFLNEYPLVRNSPEMYSKMMISRFATIIKATNGNIAYNTKKTESNLNVSHRELV